MSVLYLTTDLMFSSRVGSLAKSLGVALVTIGSPASFCEQLLAGQAELALIDLEHREANIGELVRACADQQPRPRIVAYAPHVKHSLLLAAQEAGCDIVLSRGAFDQRMSALLRSVAPPAGKATGDTAARDPAARDPAARDTTAGEAAAADMPSRGIPLRHATPPAE